MNVVILVGSAEACRFTTLGNSVQASLPASEFDPAGKDACATCPIRFIASRAFVASRLALHRPDLGRGVLDLIPGSPLVSTIP